MTGRTKSHMPLLLKVVVAFNAFAVLVTLGNLSLRVAILGDLVGDVVSHALIRLYVVAVVIITIGVVRRVGLAAVAYVALNVGAGLNFVVNVFALRHDDVRHIIDQSTPQLSQSAVAGIIAALFLLTVPVIWHRDYFRW